jgi:hypothetical protein
MKKKKNINCRSCEIQGILVIEDCNFEFEMDDILYCPCCSLSLEDEEDLDYFEDD